MSNDNFDDSMHIVKKINFFLGMCLQDVDHLNYDEESRKVLRFLLNTHGNTFLNNLVEAIVVTDKLANLKVTKELSEDLTEEDSKKIQDEWNKVFTNVGKKKFETRDLFSEGQASQEDATESGRDPSGSPDEQEGPTS